MTKTKKIIIGITAFVMVALATIFGFIFSPNKKKNGDFVFSVQTSLSLEVGQSATLTYQVPTGAQVTFTTSNPAVATIENNLVSAIAAGTATLHGVAILNGKTKFANCTVTVNGETTPEPKEYHYTIEITNGEGFFDMTNSTLSAYGDYIDFVVHLFDDDDNEVMVRDIDTPNIDDTDILQNDVGAFRLKTVPSGHIDFYIMDYDYRFTIYYQKIEKP